MITAEQYNLLREKEEKDKNMKNNISVVFAIVFVMSMVSATGAVEADKYLMAFIMTIVGITSGILTLITQSEDK
jgi:hypothetical protein|tara:strand:+ start:437 stop:658 length:222 start_codon:yes stop_codon:yes gene_type:complete